jgi:hypothetical protein
MAMLIILPLLLPGCASRKSEAPELVVIPADRQVVRMEDGHYRVTPAWLQERYEYEAWITRQLDECRTGKRADD